MVRDCANNSFREKDSIFFKKKKKCTEICTVFKKKNYEAPFKKK